MGADTVLETDVYNGEIGHAAKHNQVNAQVNFLTSEVAGRLSADDLATTIAEAVDTAADTLGVPRAGTWAEVGDSITARNKALVTGTNRLGYQDTGWGVHMRAFLGQRGHMVGNFAVSGKRADEVLTEQVPQVLALNPLPASCFVMAGTNDLGAGASVATIKTRLTAVYDALNAKGIRVVAGLITPRTAAAAGTPTVKAGILELNNWLRKLTLTRRNFEVIDFYTATTAADGDPATGVMVDGLHPTAKGAALMGRQAALTFDRLLPQDVPLPMPSDPANLCVNPLKTGTAGFKGSGVTGTVADAWTLDPVTGSVTAVASKVARTDGVAGEWQQIVVTSGSLRLGTVTAMQPFTGVTAGVDTLICRAEVECDPSMLTSGSGLGLLLLMTGGPAAQAEAFWHPSGDPVAATYMAARMVLETPPLLVPAGVTGMSLQVRAYTADGGTYRVGRTQIAKVI